MTRKIHLLGNIILGETFSICNPSISVNQITTTNKEEITCKKCLNVLKQKEFFKRKFMGDNL